MHNFTTNPVLKAAIDRAHAERNAAIRAFFISLFGWKGHVATAQAA